MKLNRRLAINLVTVLVLFVGSVSWVIIGLLGGGIGGSPYPLTADFASSGGVFTNQEVTYRGVLIGRVGDMKLNEDGVDIELLIEPEWADKIPADVIASVQSKSAVGEQFVNLTPRGTTQDVLQAGDRIARADTKLPVEFQALLRSLDRVLAELSPEATRRVVTELAGGVAGRSGEIAEILRSLGTLSDAFASVAPAQRRLLANAPRAGRAFLDTKEDFTSAMQAADEVLTSIGDEPEDLRRFFAETDRFAREGIQLLARHGSNLAGGIKALADLMTFQVENEDLVIGGLENIPGFLHAIEDSSIPWRDPSGRTYYRIRTGLVMDNLESSWPCGYRLPDDYQRYPHQRAQRRTLLNQPCLPPPDDAGEVAASVERALEAWQESNPVVAEEEPSILDSPVLRFFDLTPDL
jgi:phospholipid/cholesterol/gamma-HCH transport system substrate-binding protein